MTLPMANSEPVTRAQAYQRVLDRLRSVPGVLGTVAMSGLPPNRTPDAIATPIENYTSDDGRPFEIIDYYQFVMGDYFGTMGIPIVAGRGFERTDTASQGKVAIVDETLAKRIWKGQNPIGRPRLLAQLLGSFAGLALLLAAIGTYGVLSYIVTERRREIGIRVALGATRSHVLTQIVKEGLQVTALGVTIGLAGALAVNRLFASLLFGVQPTDTATIGFVIATITAVAVVASWLPAWRASRLDPNVVLRDE